MKIMRPIKKILFALGALALAVGGGMVAQSKQSVSADGSDDAIHAAPWGLANNMTQGVYSANDTTSGAGYSPLVYELPNQNGQSLATYMQSTNNSFDLTKDQTLSFWIYMPTSSEAAPNDGMAFFLTPHANATNSGSAGGMQLGVWGNPQTSGSQIYAYPWKTAMEDSYAIEFDTYQNRDWLDKGIGQGVTDTIGGAYPAQQSTYPSPNGYYNNSQIKTDGSNGEGMNMTGAIKGNLGTIGGAWRHITMKYTTSDHKIQLWYGDRSLSSISDTTADSESNGLTQWYKLDRTKLGNTDKLYYGFASATKTDKNLVIVDTDTNLLSANATATITDDTKGETINNSSYVVRGGESLTYQYKVNYQTSTTPAGLYKARIHTVLPKYFVPETDTIKLNTAGKESKVSSNDIKSNGDGTYTLDTTVGDLPNQNTTATVTIKGKAKEITTSDLPAGQDHINVPSAQALAYNGGIDQKVTDTGFELKPGVKTTSTATIRDLSELGSPEVGSAHVFAGDKLGYTFDVQLDADSPINWSNTITAKVDMPENNLFSDLDLNSDEKLFHVTAVYGSGQEKTGDYTYSELKAGVPVTDSTGLVKNTITNHITVTVMLNLTGTALDTATKVTVPSATATFASTLHTATATAQSFSAVTPQVHNDDSPTVVPDFDTINVDQVGDEAEGSNFVNLSGSVTDPSATNDNQITMFAQVGHLENGKMVWTAIHVQLPTGQTGRYNLSLSKPDLSKIQTFNGSKAPSAQGTLLDSTSDQWLNYGQANVDTGNNVVYLIAVDDQGRSSISKPISINVGLLKFMTATDVTFKPTTLTGSQRVVGAESAPDVTLNNSLGNQWHVTATATPFTAGDKKLKGSLYYVNANKKNTVLSDQAVPIADSSQLSTDSSNHYNVTLTEDWNASQPDASSINDVTAQGLYVQLNAGATANSDAYQSAITWTLTDGPQ